MDTKENLNFHEYLALNIWSGQKNSECGKKFRKAERKSNVITFNFAEIPKNTSKPTKDARQLFASEIFMKNDFES